MNCCKTGEKISYEAEFIDYGEEKPQKSCINKKWIIAGIVVLTLAAVGALVGSYFLNSSFHSLVNNTFTHIQNGNMSIQQALLYIGAPVAGSAFLISFAIALYKKNQSIKKNDTLPEAFKDSCHLLKQLLPERKQVLIAIGIIAGLAILATVGFLVLKFAHAPNQWWTHNALPFAQNVLNRQIKIWQGMAIIGGGALGAAILLVLAIYACKQIAAYREAKKLDAIKDKEWVL